MDLHIHLCFRPTSQPTHSEKTVSLTRVPGATPVHCRPSRPRTAPGPFTMTSKSTPLTSSSQQPPSSKSSIGSVVVASESVQPTTTTDNSSPPAEHPNTTTTETIPPKRGAIASRIQLDQGKSSSASKPQQRKSSESEFQFNNNRHCLMQEVILFTCICYTAHQQC